MCWAEHVKLAILRVLVTQRKDRQSEQEKLHFAPFVYAVYSSGQIYSCQMQVNDLFLCHSYRYGTNVNYANTAVC